MTSRDKILERRRLFVASALAGTVATQCNPCACLAPPATDSGASFDAAVAVPDASDAGEEPDVLDEPDAVDDAEAGPQDAAAKRTGRKSSARPCLIAYVPDDDPLR